MVKSKEELLKQKKTRRTQKKDDTKKYKQSKNWYPTSDEKKRFKRVSKKVRPAKLSKNIQPGQVLILLSGRFRGRRVVFLKQLPSGLLLVTGPYKVNGVPLKRVNQAYVLPTKTKVNLTSLPGLDKLTDEFFTTRVNVKRASFFEDPAKKRERITEERRTAQTQVDTELLKSVRQVPQLKEYLQNRFALKNGQRPHLMSF
jgi:large subunit ribosomal protein L6e